MKLISLRCDRKIKEVSMAEFRDASTLGGRLSNVFSDLGQTLSVPTSREQYMISRAAKEHTIARQNVELERKQKEALQKHAHSRYRG